MTSTVYNSFGRPARIGSTKSAVSILCPAARDAVGSGSVLGDCLLRLLSRLLSCCLSSNRLAFCTCQERLFPCIPQRLGCGDVVCYPEMIIVQLQDGSFDFRKSNKVKGTILLYLHDYHLQNSRQRRHIFKVQNKAHHELVTVNIVVVAQNYSASTGAVCPATAPQLPQYSGCCHNP